MDPDVLLAMSPVAQCEAVMLESPVALDPEAAVSWYAAHVVMRIRYREPHPGPLYVMENIVLVEAANPQDSKGVAEAHGRQDANPDDMSFRCDDRPAFWEYAGVRVVVSCDDAEERPGTGSEVTYMEYRVESDAALQELLSGKPTTVEFE
jgi:hypothetical protein